MDSLFDVFPIENGNMNIPACYDSLQKGTRKYFVSP